MVGQELSPAFLVLLPVAVGAGLDLFLTVIIAMVALGLGDPGSATGLGWATYGVLTVLYLLELSAEIHPRSALLWHNLQLVLRPFGAALLGLSIMEGLPLRLLLPGLFISSVVAAFVHTLSWGLKLQRFLASDGGVSPLTYSLGEDTFTLAFLVLALEHRTLGVVLVTSFLILGLLAGSPIHHLTRLGVSLIRDSVWGIVSPPGWHYFPDLPGWIRSWSQKNGLEGVRGFPAGAMGLPGVRGVRTGWLLEAGTARFFGFKQFRRPRIAALGGLELRARETSKIHQRIRLEGRDGSETALFLQKHAPAPESHKW